MSSIFHITTRAAWQEVEGSGHDFVAASLDTEGFIHCSTAEQAVWVANRRFRASADPLVLLRIEPGLLSHGLKWESSEPGMAPFPHIEGPINLSAVVGVLPFVEGPQGFTAPPQ